MNHITSRAASGVPEELTALRMQKAKGLRFDELQRLYREGCREHRIGIQYMSCCGYQEICGIKRVSPKDVLRGILMETRYIPGQGCAGFVFTQASPPGDTLNSYGARFAEWLSENDLGTVVQAHPEPVRNPNSGNDVTMWIWFPDRDKCYDYIKKSNLFPEGVLEIVLR